MQNSQPGAARRFTIVLSAAAVLLGLAAFAGASSRLQGAIPGVGVKASPTATRTTALSTPALSPLPAANTPKTARIDSPPAASTDALQLASADRISIKVQGQKDLSGDYRINEDQTVSVPVLGRVPLVHLDAAGLEKSLADRIARLTGREAYVTVEVIDYRPVFVSGYVNHPGSAPWKPGMTVLQAVTVSGGTFRSASSNGISGVDTKQQRAVDDQKRVLATIARLTAEQSGAAAIELPPRLIALVGRHEAETLIAAQQTSFLSRKAATETLVEGLKRGIALAKAELETTHAQRARLGEQLTFRQAQYGRLKAVYDRQFLRIDRLSEEEIRISDLEEKLASLGVAASRIEGTLAGLERELANFRQDRRALIDTDLLKLERDAAQFELEIEGAGPVPRKPVTRPLSDAEPAGAVAETLIFEIVRHDGAVPRTIMAERNSPLKPGDMVVVSVQ